MANTYYELLQVEKSATPDEIKSSYRKLAIKYHPDKNQNDPKAAETFMQISKAYETLFDPERRKAYDQEQSSPRSPSGATRQTTAAKGGVAANFDLASALHVFMQNFRGDQVWQNMFAGREDQVDPTVGSNRQIQVSLTLREVAKGCKKNIKVKHLKKCVTCKGTGSRTGKSNLAACAQCAGKGKVRMVGTAETVICNKCAGAGSLPSDPCSACQGTGRVTGDTTIAVKFPAGIAEGNYITLSGMGDAGVRNGKAGDLIIAVNEIPQEVFKRDGYDLETEATITLSTAVLGGMASIVDLNGKTQSFRINPGTQPATKFCITGKGLPFYRQKGQGNLYIALQVEIPTGLSEEQESSFKEFISLYEKRESGKLYRQVGIYYIIDLSSDKKKATINDAFNTAEALCESQVPIVLNCEGVDYVDSALIGRMIKVYRLMNGYSEKLRFMQVSDSLMRIFEDTSLDNLFEFIEDESSLDSQEDSAGDTNSSYSVKEINGHHLVSAGEDCSMTILEDNNLFETLADSGASVGIDLSKVTAVGSNVLGSWMRYYKKAKSGDSDFFLFSPRGAVLSVLQTTNLDKLLKIVSSEKELQE